jgi:predicted Zn-dependent protease with MMP-like domain
VPVKDLWQVHLSQSCHLSPVPEALSRKPCHGRSLLSRKVTREVAAPSPGENAGVIAMAPAQFEELVAHALERVPRELAQLVDNVVFVIVDDAPPDDPDLLGLYEGIALTERDSRYAGALPDRISIYRTPILRICDTVDDVVEEVIITVVHEIAHHFGIDDDRLHELGYD